MYLTKNKAMIVRWGLIIALYLIIIVAIGVGSVSVAPIDVWNILKSKIINTDSINTVSLEVQDIIWEIRTPRVILAAVSGAGLALAGLVMQASVQNPLAEPFILGIASGASVGAVVAILLGGMLTVYGITLGVASGAFIGAIVATLGVLLLAGIRQRLSTVRLILAGAVVSALCTAISNFIIYMAADAEGMQSAAFWTMGSFAGNLRYGFGY